jgi:hypothetical protein
MSVLNTDLQPERSNACARGRRRRLQVADVGQNIEPIEVCLFDGGSDVDEPLLDTIKKLFFIGNSPATPGLLVDREAAPVFARSITESAGSARRAFEQPTRTVIQSDWDSSRASPKRASIV